MGVLDSFKMDGEVAFVTGAASGIGRQISTAMAEAGADVVLADIDEAGATEVADEIADATGAATLAVEVDVTDPEAVDAAVEATVEEFGRLDAAFANAGIAELERQVGNYDAAQWERIIGVNLSGVFHTDRAAAAVMAEQEDGGSIVNTASVYGLRASNLMGTMYAYTAAKGGVVNLTRALATTVGEDGVRVNAIAPSHVRTQIAGGYLQEDAPGAMQTVQERIVERTPLGRISEPEEIKGLAVFLASDASSYCTGYTYAVDGGWLTV
jgi:NAD(P)-dependent dehydrogenase (short-subunit alcohol dehydrogenase family)